MGVGQFGGDGIGQGCAAVAEDHHVPAVKPFEEPVLPSARAVVVFGQAVEEKVARSRILRSDDGNGEREQVVVSIEAVQRNDTSLVLRLELAVVDEEQWTEMRRSALARQQSQQKDICTNEIHLTTRVSQKGQWVSGGSNASTCVMHHLQSRMEA